ncbi:MAG: DNA/RNA nuclease SfsA [Colwellia sp.]|nr:DNA/RNA nuclease SfsA [Colwellia sp.]
MKLLLQPARLLKRYKRFLADIEFTNGEKTTIHCANTGAMKGCAEPGDTVWYSTSDNVKRKYPLSWEITQSQAKHFICVNTLRANQLVEEALHKGIVSEITGFELLQREVQYGSEKSRVDFLATYTDAPNAYIEVKSVTLLEDKHGLFPDAVTTRGQKHLRELMEMRAQGHRAILFFAVLHSGINDIAVASHIDPKYAELLKEASIAGVDILAYKAEFTLESGELNINLNNKIPFIEQ